MGGTLSITDNGEFLYNNQEDLFPERVNHTSRPFDCIDALAQSLQKFPSDFSDSTLLLSEGKDSTAIAIAFAEIGIKLDCITFANSDTNVEFIESVATRFGHNLTVFRYRSFAISDDAVGRLRFVFEPTLDQAFLSYLLLPFEQLQGRMLIDGMGNDVSMGHLPSKQQRRATAVCEALTRVVPQTLRNRLRDACCNDYAWSGIPFRSFTECQGFFNGFSQSLVESSTGGKVHKLRDLDDHWREFGFEKARALSRGRFLDTYSYSGKSIALAEMIGGRAYFPWTAPEISSRYIGLPDTDRFAWPIVNKLPLRAAIQKRMKYDQPKVGFRAPVREILLHNRQLVLKTIRQSQTLGDPLIEFLLALPPHSPRLACGFLYALWEHAGSPPNINS